MNLSTTKKNNRIAVTGMGVLGAHGADLSSFENVLRMGISQFKKSHHFSNLSFPVIASELMDFSFEEPLKHYSTTHSSLIDRLWRAGRRAPITIQTSLLSMLAAWEQAGLSQRLVDKSRIGLIVAGQNTTRGYQYRLQPEFHHESTYLSPTYALHFMDTDQVGTLSDVFEIKGEGFTVGGASASGNVGIIQACRLIHLGIVDICVVAGVMADLSPMEIQGFYNIGALGGRKFKDQPELACRPFDAEHEGFLLGQASGCLILESTTFADKYSIPALGYIAGGAMNLDSNRLSDPNQMGEVNVMRQAMINAQLSKDEIQYINTHGTSSPLGDTTEILAIKEIWRESIEKIALNATKSICGHCLWSAGIIEVIATIIQMQNNFLHPNLNLQNPIDKNVRFVGRQAENANIEAALSNAFGFGGINTSLVITRK